MIRDAALLVPPPALAIPALLVHPQRMTADRINALLAQAYGAQQEGNGGRAAQLYQEVLAIVPDHPGALNSLGVMAINRGDGAAAADFHARAAAADPKAGPLWLNLARAQRELGDVEGERASLNRALEINRLDFMALVRMAQLHERLGELAEALPLWSGIVQIAPPPAQRNEAMNALIAHARDFVTTHSNQLALWLDEGLAEARAEYDGAALRRFDACVDVVLGRRRVYLNQCEGVHFPFLPADEFFDRSHFPWLAAIEAQTAAIRDELLGLIAADAPGFAPYVEQAAGTPANIWSTLDHSLDWSAYYLWKYGERIEDACTRCPQTAAALDTVPGLKISRRAPTAFFSLLRPKTHIPPHTGVTNTRTIIHLPLIVPEGCGFRVGGETRQWEVGTAFAFDDTIEHEAWNNSDELRAVLIFDVWNPHINPVERALLQRFFDLSDEAEVAPKQLRTL